MLGVSVRHQEEEGEAIRQGQDSLCQLASQTMCDFKLPYKASETKHAPDFTLDFLAFHFFVREKKKNLISSRLNEDDFEPLVLLHLSTQSWGICHCGPFYRMLAGQNQGPHECYPSILPTTDLPSQPGRFLSLCSDT